MYLVLVISFMKVSSIYYSLYEEHIPIFRLIGCADQHALHLKMFPWLATSASAGSRPPLTSWWDWQKQDRGSLSIEKVAEPTLDAIVDALADGEFCAGVGEGCPEVVDFVIRCLFFRKWRKIRHSLTGVKSSRYILSHNHGDQTEAIRHKVNIDCTEKI